MAIVTNIPSKSILLNQTIISDNIIQTIDTDRKNWSSVGTNGIINWIKENGLSKFELEPEVTS